MIFGDKKAVADVVASLQKELLLRVSGEPPHPLRCSWKLRILTASLSRLALKLAGLRRLQVLMH